MKVKTVVIGILETGTKMSQNKEKQKLVLLWAQLTKIYPPLPTSVQPISITKTLLIVPTKDERDPPKIFNFAVPELLDLIWRKIGFLPYVAW
jgi:hypothetical protein